MMRKYQTGDAELWATAIVFVLMLTLVLVVSAISCSTKWEDSGFASRWKVFGGCQIKTKDGKWIPDKNYREMT